MRSPPRSRRRSWPADGRPRHGHGHRQHRTPRSHPPGGRDRDRAADADGAVLHRGRARLPREGRAAAQLSKADVAREAFTALEALPGAIEVIEKEYSTADQVAQRAADLAADAASALKRTIERLKLEKAKSESY